MSTVLLTGASGFIGSELLKQLNVAGCNTVVLGRRAPSVPQENSTFLCADLRDAGAVADVLRPYQQSETLDVLIHLAASIPTQSVPTDALDEMLRDNLGPTQNLLQSLPVSVKHIVYASTLDVYGPPQWLPLDETHPLEPVTAYAQAKKQSEQYVAEHCRERKLKLAILRLTQIYGPHEPAIKAIPRFIAGIHKGHRPKLFGDGSDLRDYLYVVDAARAFVLAQEKVVEGIFNIASGTSVSIEETLRLLLRLMESPLEPEFCERQKPVMHFRFDTANSRELLGFYPTTSFEDGLLAEIRATRDG